VQDPSLLDLPAVLVSISNMPVSARPQAGPGFAAWVYELYIGEGVTRFMNVFYGEYPRTIPNISGGCEVRDAIIRPSGIGSATASGSMRTRTVSRMPGRRAWAGFVSAS
jgi:hypothetical protein